MQMEKRRRRIHREARLESALHVDRRDRSLACGTGTSAKMAVLHAKGQLSLCRDFVHEGILGTHIHLDGSSAKRKLVRTVPVGVPTISGRAWITGFANYFLDARYSFPEGFTIGDIW